MSSPFLPQPRRRIKQEPQFSLSPQLSKSVKLYSKSPTTSKSSLPNLSKNFSPPPSKSSPPEPYQSFLSLPHSPKYPLLSLPYPDGSQLYVFSRPLFPTPIPLSEKEIDDSIKICILQKEISKLKKTVVELQTVIAEMTDKVNHVANLML